MRRLLVLIYMLAAGYAVAEVPALEREITLSVSNERLNIVLSKIQEQTGLIFSYPSTLIHNAPAVSMKLKQKTVREALLLILPKGITFKARNHYIILKEKPVEANPKKTELNGYVYDKATDKKLANVTIYDKSSLQSVTTDDYGYYSISLPTSNQNLVVNKENYKDTSLLFSDLTRNSLTNITLNPIGDSLKGQDSVLWKAKLKDLSDYTAGLFKKFKGYVNTLNVKDTLSRNLQVSFLPFIGSNHKLSGSIYNRYSFNLLGGYSRGVKGLEMGTLFNVNKESMSGLQMAGLFNLVGRQVDGVQLAGLFNVAGVSSKGVQAAGLWNYTNGNQAGVQMAGLGNINRGKIEGVSMAGLMNISKASVSGVQLAGLANLVQDSLDGINAAGLFNHCRYMNDGVQLAGLFNAAAESYQSVQLAGLANLTTDSLKGGVNVAGLFNRCGYSAGAVQVAGMFNVAGHGDASVQIAGLFNAARHMRGIHIAPLNFCDSASGVPVGIFSFVKKGVHQLELSADEVLYVNAGFRTGVPSFYNIFTMGVSAGPGKLIWSLGYGVGTSVRLKNKLRSDFTLSTQHLNRGGFSTGLTELYKAYAGLEYTFKKNFRIAAGPVFNLYVSDTKMSDYAGNYNNIAPYRLAENTSADGTKITYWLGGRISIRLF